MTLSHFSLMMFALVAAAERIRDLEDLALMELQSERRTQKRFESAFSEVQVATRTCPYGDETAAKAGTDKSFSCHGFATGGGTTCPALQAMRIKTVRAFQINHHASFLEGVGGYPLAPVFDKSKHIRGDETHEELMKLQIKGLMHEDIVNFEDKIYLKKLADRLGIPTTKLYFGAHQNDWERENFNKALEELCTTSKIDAFFMKPTHLAWSKGIKIVRNFRSDYCDKDPQQKQQKMDEYATFIETEILAKKASEADAHLRKYLTPGVTVESLFQTGGASTQPLEAKVQVVWGKVHHMFIFGMDHRGCRVHVGAWQIYGDKTGWDLKGIIKPRGGNDELGDRLLEEAFQPMVDYAERFARSLEADFMRVDFFLRPPDAETGGDWKIEMNECESVTGSQHTFERRGLEAIWRDGYIMSRLAMDSEKFQKIRNNTQEARNEWKLDE
jgi:hypothetical protein